jgi:hypothetical protein
MADYYTDFSFTIDNFIKTGPDRYYPTTLFFLQGKCD